MSFESKIMKIKGKNKQLRKNSPKAIELIMFEIGLLAFRNEKNKSKLKLKMKRTYWYWPIKT